MELFRQLFPKVSLFCAVSAMFAGSIFTVSAQPIRQVPVTPEEQAKIESAIPAKARAKPKKARKVLAVTLNVTNGRVLEKGTHASIEHNLLAFQLMGRKTGAFELVHSNDLSMLKPENLKQFDAICFLNTTGVLTEDNELRQSLLNFVREGKGFVGLHAVTATFVQYPKYDQFPQFGEMIGAYENGGHPWRPNETVTLKVEEPKHPLNAAFKTATFEVQDQIFQFKDFYSRDKLRVLISVDTDKTDMNPKRRFLPERANDKDFGISWVKKYGKGRVFYSSLGHNPHIFWNPSLLQHFLDGIQYALGDLKADDRPSAEIKRN
jgi:type 1 glutamine amidotransferase